MTPFQELVRRLAVTAQETLYHDIDPSMPEYRNGVEALVRSFTPILRGKVKARALPPTKQGEPK